MMAIRRTNASLGAVIFALFAGAPVSSSVIEGTCVQPGGFFSAGGPPYELSRVCEVTPGPAPTAPDVPLRLWRNAEYPNGLSLGETMGVSWGDYDADGFIDLFACQSGRLWHNVGGMTWELAADLRGFMPPAERRYGSSFGDYNNDGLPDIATAPRVPIWGDDRMHLLKNLGEGPNFVDVAFDEEIIDAQPYNNAETLCWADVDGDRNLDLFVPVYPPWVGGGPGNFFLSNQGPPFPGGEPCFHETAASVGLDNTPGSPRPEGAQFADVDFDGDVDLFSNGTLYRNRSSLRAALFEPMLAAASGIGLGASLDEGAMFFDYDLDGDQDLVVTYVVEGVRIWENRGDGTFFAAEPGIVGAPFIGLNLGLSAEDWDNDGDIDFTTRQVFRRNMLIEEGSRHFKVATHAINASHLTSATPAWGDWDRDGDLDCAVGDWGDEGHLYENTLYGPGTPDVERRYVRVRVLGGAPGPTAGLEVEYGATVELHLAGDPSGPRRRKFVASSHGYLNQNEYTLHFALPPYDEEAQGQGDLRFDLTVDFPDVPSRGLWRLDRSVNQVLGDIDLAALANRQIDIYRCGQVALGGTLHDPSPLAPISLTTTAEGLAQPTATSPLPPLASAPDDYWVGLAIDTGAAATNLAVKEIIVDAELHDAVDCAAGSFNIALWDVTDPSRPILAPGGMLNRRSSPRDHRSHLPADLVLEPQRVYRLVARVRGFRPTSIAAPLAAGALTVLGGTYFTDTLPCTGTEVVSAIPDLSATSMAIRFAAVPASLVQDPMGDLLRLQRNPGGSAMLGWQDVGAAAYRVRRCTRAAGPCLPATLETIVDNDFVDDATIEAGELFCYLVDAVNACTAGF